MVIFLKIFISFIALLWSANHLVIGTSGIIRRYNLSPILIGLILVAFGTCAPDLIYNIMTFLKKTKSNASGTPFGINLANISLILGIAVYLKPPSFKNTLIRNSFPIIVLGIMLIFKLLYEGTIGILDGCLILISGLLLLAYLIFLTNHSQSKDSFIHEFKLAATAKRTLNLDIINLCLGFILLPISSRYFTLSMTELFKSMNVYGSTFTLTIIAICSTLPVLVTSMIAAIKGKEELALGTILGANVYALIVLMILPGLLPIRANVTGFTFRDIGVMIVLMLIIFFANLNYKEKMVHWQGQILFFIYVSFIMSMLLAK